jgi:threonine/homoserine/homoserine lactone efflux protein
MLQVIGEGIIAGIIVSISVGPIFFMLLDISINRGLRNAMMYIAGVFVSDILMVYILQAGLFVTIQNTPLFKDNFYLIGGGLLFVLGVTRLLYLILTPAKQTKNENLSTDHASTYSRSMFQGFLVNTMTPTVFLFWVGMATLHSKRSYAAIPHSLLIFFISIIATVIVLDIAKAKLAVRLKTLLTPTMVVRLNIILAIIISIIGFRMLLLGFDVI